MSSDRRPIAPRISRGLLWSLAIVPPTVVFATCLSFCVGPPSYYSAKHDGSSVKVRADAKPSRWSPHKQVEPHTCGLEALSSIYIAYGLDPEAANLRFRLGTDMQATNFDPESLGTIRPDILRVVEQDGFVATTLLVLGKDATLAIREHLASGHPVLALIRVRGLHWIVLTAIEDNKVVVCDSLKEGMVREPFEKFVDERVLSAILLRPKQ